MITQVIVENLIEFLNIVKNIEMPNLLTLQMFDHDCDFIIKNDDDDDVLL